ncbi:MAG: ATP-dependent RecD-like DNA helicase [Nitrospirota bacterium]
MVRVVYRAVEGGYTVLTMRALGRDLTPFSAVGELPETMQLREQQAWLITGSWVTSPKYGRQFRLTSLSPHRPASAEALEALLASGIISGVGPERARRITQTFGVNAWDLMNQASERLMEIPGIGPGVFRTITESWRQHQQQAELLSRLCALGLTLSLSVKAVKHFGSATEGIVQTNPYRLTEIRGIGFKTADLFSRSLGIKPTAPYRLIAGLREVLRQATVAGHTFLPESTLYEGLSDLLGLDRDSVRPALSQACGDGEVVCDDGRVYSADLYRAERAVERRLSDLVRRSAVRWQGSIDPRTTPEQAQAVTWAMTMPCSILTGLPGTGKTYTVAEIVRLSKQHRQQVVLCAPTGKAARRMTELSGVDACTIHRLLEFSPDVGFRRCAGHPLDADLVVVDEASMMDLPLFDSLLSAIGPRTRLLLVGDQHQLPSVGPGQILRDLIASGWIPVTTLTRIQRQAELSGIITWAHQVHAGTLPPLRTGEYGALNDLFLMLQDDPAELATSLEQVLRDAGRSFAPQDIQVLAPMHKGPLGTVELNERIRAVLNPQAGKGPRLGKFAPGDRVVQNVNNYDKEIFNGEVGLVVDVDLEDAMLTVRFGERPVSYSIEDLADLDLAFCLTIHKAQGSEFPCVIVVLHRQHYIMQRRELLYTAMTRAKQRLVLLASAEALRIAAKRTDAARRYSSLCAARPVQSILMKSVI